MILYICHNIYFKFHINQMGLYKSSKHSFLKVLFDRICVARPRNLSKKKKKNLIRTIKIILMLEEIICHHL